MLGRERRSRRLALALALALPWAATGARGAVEFGGGVTGIVLHADDSKIRNDATASLDLTFAHVTQRGELFAYVEASSSLDEDRVSSLSRNPTPMPVARSIRNAAGACSFRSFITASTARAKDG